MQAPTRSPAAVILLPVLFALLLAGCLPARADPSPPAVPPPVDAGLFKGVPTACISLAQLDCDRARQAALDQVTPDDPDPVYVAVGSFWCPEVPGCPTTLAARPEGDVTIEFAGGVGVSVHVRANADGSLDADRMQTFSVAAEPTSVAGASSPMPYDLGHCGLHSGIDVDGSFWDPVGPIDGDHPNAINAAEGVLVFLGRDRATFTANDGFLVSLVRHGGPKMLPLCD